MEVQVDRTGLLLCGSLHPTVQEDPVLETSELCQEFRWCKQVRQPELVITVSEKKKINLCFHLGAAGTRLPQGNVCASK